MLILGGVEVDLYKGVSEVEVEGFVTFFFVFAVCCLLLLVLYLAPVFGFLHNDSQLISCSVLYTYHC